MADTATKTNPMLANQTPEDLARNRVLGRVTRRNRTIVTDYLKSLAAEEWKLYAEALENDEEYGHPNASLLYALVGFPWIEDENGDLVRDEERYNESVAKHYNSPDMEWIVENPENETITLLDLELDENNAPIEIEVSADDEGEIPFKTKEIEVSVTDAVREYVLGFRADGKAPRGGMTVKQLLVLQPGVGAATAADIIAESGINKPDTELRSLRRGQYTSLLFNCGAEERLEEDMDELEDEIEAENAEIEAEGDDTVADESEVNEDEDDADADEEDADEDSDDEQSDLDAAAENYNDSESDDVEEDADEDDESEVNEDEDEEDADEDSDDESEVNADDNEQ